MTSLQPVKKIPTSPLTKMHVWAFISIVLVDRLTKILAVYFLSAVEDLVIIPPRIFVFVLTFNDRFLKPFLNPDHEGANILLGIVIGMPVLLLSLSFLISRVNRQTPPLKRFIYLFLSLIPAALTAMIVPDLFAPTTSITPREEATYAIFILVLSHLMFVGTALFLTTDKVLSWGLIFWIACVISNKADLLLNPEAEGVVDFMLLFDQYEYIGIFNVADIFYWLGLILIFIVFPFNTIKHMARWSQHPSNVTLME